ncbi:MAG: TolC family protein [Prolixibacteraceae bacterium]
MKRAPILIIILLCLGFAAKSQNSNLNLEEAITIGLKNNFAIQISGNDAKIAANNNSLGNAGFLPVIGVTGGVKENIASTNIKDTKDVTTTSNNQRTGTTNVSATLDWTLFNGFAMFIKRERLSSLQTLQETSLRATVENTVSEIVTSYFAVVQLKNSLQVLQNAIDFSNSRYELTRKKLQIGTASELAFLKSSTDLNADSAAFLRQKVALANAKSKLNTLLVLDPEKNFDVTTPIQFDKLLDYNNIKEGLPSINSQISLAKQSADISLLDYRLTNAPKYPQIGFFTDYNWSLNKYNFGTSSSVQSNGPVVGLSFSMPIFDGFNKKRITENARITTETLKLDYQLVLKNTQASLWQVYNEYKNNLNLVRLETANLEVSRHTAKISFERFRVGEMSDYELRQIQLSELEAENSLIVAQFQAKKSETELLRLSGNLVHENR